MFVMFTQRCVKICPLDLMFHATLSQDFCTFCCREQIEDTYGKESVEMDRFEDTIESIQ